ncbi:FkbM family methyltransferase [uncultured Jannaschia sp.]|uniref:FkbM family methyltransferase n=1 Tax=uncultured Jannaschia sp. TaxID=293347 RepID=UPI002611E65E|nr:FkbM family methyltransferase [uncultured Jannaschia sp.]
MSTITDDIRAKRQARRLGQRLRRATARGLLDGILSQLRPGDVALDCGANVGDVAEPLAETGATVFAFEPDPLAFDTLARRLAPYPAAHAVHAAVGVTRARATLRRSSRFAGDALAATTSSTLLPGKRDADTEGAHDVEVDVLSLPELIAALAAGSVPPPLKGAPGRLALLKLDVEGSELDLLPTLHAAGLLNKIACTLVETHQRKFPDRRRDVLAMRREIAAAYPARKVNLDWI